MIKCCSYFSVLIVSSEILYLRTPFYEKLRHFIKFVLKLELPVNIGHYEFICTDTSLGLRCNAL